jgi:hypothetical protein
MSEKERATRALTELKAARARYDQLLNRNATARTVKEIADTHRALAIAYHRASRYLPAGMARSAAVDASMAFAQLAARDGA